MTNPFLRLPDRRFFLGFARLDLAAHQTPRYSFGILRMSAQC